jgi:HlyD family secretion protein
LRRVAPLVVLVAVVAAGSVAYAANSGSGPSYVTGVVARGDVQQTLDLTGSVQQVNQVDATFPVSGRVASVSVTVGQQVSAGQELARIDTAPLQTALLAAQASLAQAQATLQSDESGTPASPTTATNSAAITEPAPRATLTAFTPGTGSNHGGTDLGSLAAAVAAAQSQAASSQVAVNTALSAALTACAASTPSPSPSGSPTPSPSGSATPTPTPSGSVSGHATVHETVGPSCADALAAVQRAETAEAAATKALGAAVSKLAAAAAQAQSAGGAAGAGSKTGSGAGNGAGNGSGASHGPMSGTARSGGGTSGGRNLSGSGTASAASSAARIASDQADVTTAQVAVADAQRNLDAAILRAPTAGVVASLGLTTGSTASTSSAITIVSQGAARVTVDVPLASMPSVRVGQTAFVTPNGASTADKGMVTSIGLLPASSSTSTASYPVTVLVPDSELMQLPTGSSAQVSLVMSTVHNAITVPNSAVTRLGTGDTAFVTVLENGTANRTRVTLGAVGTLATQVTAGLSVGQTVVLANRSAPLPANSSTTARIFGTGGGFGGFGGSGPRVFRAPAGSAGRGG